MGSENIRAEFWEWSQLLGNTGSCAPISRSVFNPAEFECLKSIIIVYVCVTQGRAEKVHATHVACENFEESRLALHLYVGSGTQTQTIQFGHTAGTFTC